MDADNFPSREAAPHRREKRLLFTLHGINSPPPDRNWQALAEKIFSPHFTVKALDYEHFRADKLLGRLANFARVAADFGLPRSRSTMALRRVTELFRQHNRADGCHLIAHSFGTVVAASLMREPTTRFARVIFVGSPLSARHPWDDVLRRDPKKFDHLRNEMGWRDLVVRTAGIASLIPWPRLWGGNRLGAAGVFGFKCSHAHDIAGPLSPCERCGLNGQSRMHNVRLETYDHSKKFMQRTHMELLWLPELLGVEPEVHWQLTELCTEGEHYPIDSLEKEENLREIGALRSRWLFGRGESFTFEQYVKGHLRTKLRYAGLDHDEDELREGLPAALEAVRTAIVKAVRERDRSEGEADTKALESLSPMIAVVRGVSAVAHQKAKAADFDGP